MRSTSIAAPSQSRLLVPGLVMLVALAWIGGHFTSDASGREFQLLVGLAHLVPVAVVGAELVSVAHNAGSRAGRRSLLAVSMCVKTFTLFAIAWTETHPTGFGIRGVMDWMPVGLVNAGSGLTFLVLIRSRTLRSA